MSASVLWVFERPDQRDRVKAALELAGFGVRVADENLAALETFQRTRPDLVVIEVALPDTEKLELCQVLKATPQGDDTPVLVVTGAADGMSFRAQAIHQYDADEFVYPFDPTRIAAACKRWLERARAKPRTTPAPHQAALEDALDKLDTLLEDAVISPVENTDSPIAAQPSTARIAHHANPLRESIEELTRMSDDLVDRLPIQGREDAVEQAPPANAPKDIARLHQTLQELESMVDDDDDTAVSAEVELAGDRGDDIQAHLDTMFRGSEHRVDAPARRHAEVVEPVEFTEAPDEGDGEELVTIESEGGDDPGAADGDLDSWEPVPEPNVPRRVERELGRRDEDEAEELPVAAKVGAGPAMHEPWSPSAIDPSLPRMGVPNERPQRGRSRTVWVAATAIVLAAGAGILWSLLSGRDASEPATVAAARPIDSTPAIGATAGALGEPTRAAVESPEPTAAVDPLDTDAGPVTPPPSPFAARREAAPVEAVNRPVAAARADSSPRPPASQNARPAPDSARPPIVPAKTSPEPQAIAAKPVAPPDPDIAPRKPVVTTTVAHGPKPPQSPPKRETSRTSSGSVEVAEPAKSVARLADEPSTPVRPRADDVAGPSAPEPRRMEVREAPPFVNAEKTAADPKQEGRPSDTLVAVVEPPTPPPPMPVVTPEPAPTPSDTQAVPTSPGAMLPVPETKPKPPVEPEYEPPRSANRAEPVYPSRAYKAGVSGTVVLDVLVDESGTPVRVVVKDGVGNAEIEAAAIHAVLRSSFDPARRDGAAVRGWTTVEYAFGP